MSSLSMRRGKNQVLYRYLPGKPIDFGQGKAIALVNNWIGRNVSSEVNKNRILNEVWRAKQSFGANTRGYPRVLDKSMFQLLEPGQVEADLFPLTFICESCNRAYSFASTRQFNRTLRSHRCNCGGRLNQLDLIYYHECGNLWAPTIPRCPVHGFQHIKLNRHQSNSPKDWRWDCGICNIELKNLNNWCQACRNEGRGSQVYPRPFRQSSVFTPQTFTVVNLSKNVDDSRIESDKSYQRIVLAKYLGLLGETEIDEAFKTLRNGSGRKYDKIEKWKQQIKDPAMLKELLKDFDIDPEGRSKIQETESRVEQLMDPPNLDLLPCVQASYDFIRTKKESALVSLDEIISHAKRNDHPDLERVEKFRPALESIGIQDAHVLNDLSIANVVYGFTRGKMNDDAKVLNAFPADKSTRQGIIPIYMNLSHTEAILLEFDRRKIIEWLIENGHEIDMPKDESELKAWFLNNIDIGLINPFKPIHDQTEVFGLLNDRTGYTRDVYKLIHSISHTLLSTAASECGLDKNSLAELIMPSIPAAIIYCSNIQQFQTGGMFTLFENNIIPWIPKAKEKAELCIYDPVCMDHQSSCHACIQLSEISCEHFNHDLGRDVLVGKDTQKRKIMGFWAMLQEERRE